MSNELTSQNASADINVSSSIAIVEDDPKFELFPKLPVELRLKIWGLACYTPRIVPLWLQPLGYQPELHKAISAIEDILNENEEIKLMYEFDTVTRIPAVMESCAEAKREGSRYYTREFGSGIENYALETVNLNITIPPRIYVNWEVDTICFMSPTFDSELSEGDAWRRLVSFFFDHSENREKFKRIAFGESFLGGLLDRIDGYFPSSYEVEEIVIYWSSFTTFPPILNSNSLEYWPPGAQFDLTPVNNGNDDIPSRTLEKLKEAKECLNRFSNENGGWAFSKSEPPNITFAILEITERRHSS